MSGEFCCHICAEFFDNERDLQKHFTVHGQVSQNVQCPKCNRAFLRKDHLKAHIESVHREGASKFICQPCQKPFSNASNLKRHLAYSSHSGVDKLPEAKRRRPLASTCTSAKRPLASTCTCYWFLGGTHSVFLSDKRIFMSASLEHHLMTVQTLLSKQNIFTDDNLLTHSDLLRTIYRRPFTLF